MLPYQFFIVSSVIVPENPDAVENRRPSAALLPPTFPEGETFVRVGQGWRTVYVNVTPFTDQRVAYATVETYPEPKRWSVHRGKTYRHAGLNTARWKLRFEGRLSGWVRGDRPKPRALKRDRLGSEEDLGRSVGGRHEVYELAPVESERALAIARAIPLPWYRCQSLTYTAQALPPERRIDVLKEALAAAREQSDPNRIVTVSSYPLAALTSEPDAEALVVSTVTELLGVIRTLEHPFRRADGIRALAFGPPAMRLMVLLEAADLYLSCRSGWKVDRRLKHLARLLAPLDVIQAIRVARGIANGRIRRQTLRRLDATDIA